MSAKITLADTARSIFTSALAACSVDQAFLSKLDSEIDDCSYSFTLRGGNDEPGAQVDLKDCTRVIVIAAGKGASTMLTGLLSRLRMPKSSHVLGVLIAPKRPPQLPEGIEFFAGGHPLPNSESFAGAKAVLSLLKDAAASANPAQTFCFFLLSGGASAMMELPLDDSISLADTIAFHRALVHCGASISEINCVRKHFSAVKGGRLGDLAAAIPNLTVLVSDVPQGQLDALASGPTIPDPSTLFECREILRRYELLPHFPSSVRHFFASTGLPETPKPGSFQPHVSTLLSAADLAQAAQRHAESLGFSVTIDNSCDDWDYRPAAEYLLSRLRDLRRQHKKVCLISVGEVTVRLSQQVPAPPRPPIGGRNQHFALYAATLLDPSDRPTVVFSAGSDGIDGNSPYAGTTLDYDRLQSAADLTASAQEALSHFDSSTFLHGIDATVETGPTGNNLRDLRLLLSE